MKTTFTFISSIVYYFLYTFLLTLGAVLSVAGFYFFLTYNDTVCVSFILLGLIFLSLGIVMRLDFTPFQRWLSLREIEKEAPENIELCSM